MLAWDYYNLSLPYRGRSEQESRQTQWFWAMCLIHLRDRKKSPGDGTERWKVGEAPGIKSERETEAMSHDKGAMLIMTSGQSKVPLWVGCKARTQAWVSSTNLLASLWTYTMGENLSLRHHYKASRALTLRKRFINMAATQLLHWLWYQEGGTTSVDFKFRGLASMLMSPLLSFSVTQKHLSEKPTFQSEGRKDIFRKFSINICNMF